MDGKQIKILPPRMDDFLNRGIANDLPKCIEGSVRLDCGKIDDRGRGLGGHLDQFQFGDETVFAHRFCIEGESRAIFQVLTQLLQRAGGRDVLALGRGRHEVLILRDYRAGREAASALYCSSSNTLSKIDRLPESGGVPVRSCGLHCWRPDGVAWL